MTTPNPKPAPESGERYLLVKRGLYYRPDNRGYTGIKDHAGRYLASDASPDCGVTAIHEDQAPEYSEACYPDVMAEHLAKKIASLTSELATVKKRLESAEEALRPFAEYADFFNDCEQHPGGCPDGASAGEVLLTVGDFRKARALQEQEKQNG